MGMTCVLPQKFKSSTCVLAQQFATWGERQASLCGGNTLSSQELQTPFQHDQLLLDNVNNSRPQHFSLRSDQRLEGSDAQVGGTTCWSSSSVMLVVFSRASTSSKLWHWRIWKKQVFSSVSSEQKHKNGIFTLLSSMQKSSLSPLWYCQFHLDFQFCHGWVNLNQLKGPPGHLLPGGLPGLVPLADITKIYRNVPKLYQNIPKITPDIPKLCQDMTSCLVASLAWILLQRPRSPRASHLPELNNSQTNNILEATRTLSSNDPFHSYSYQPIRT